MIFGKKEWVSEISGIFFFPLWRKKKNTALFLTEKKIPGYFSAKLSISDRKKQRYFSKLSTPIFLPKLWITDEKTKITFWPKLGISDGNKKIPPYFCKNCLFLAEIKKYPLFLPKPSKSCAGKKKIPRPTKRSEWVPSVSFPGKKNTTPLVRGNNNIGIKKCATNFLWVLNLRQVGGRRKNFQNYPTTVTFWKMVSKVIF